MPKNLLGKSNIGLYIFFNKKYIQNISEILLQIIEFFKNDPISRLVTKNNTQWQTQDHHIVKICCHR